MTPTMPHTKLMDTASLSPYANNSRIHSEAQISKIAASIQEFGFLNPVVMGDGVIIAGHARVAAAMKLGLKQVPVLDASYLTEAQRRAFVIADNRLAEDGEWDDAKLRAELHDLQKAGLDLSLTGMEDAELARMVRLDREYQPVLNPDKASSVVTPEELAKAQGKLEARFDKPGQQKLVTATCPHCGEDFQISADNVQ